MTPTKKHPPIRLATAGLALGLAAACLGCSSPPPEPPLASSEVDLSTIETESKTTVLE